MFRRIVATFVIVGFLAGQWAAVPHAHAGASQAPRHAHSTTPHVHLSWFCGDCPGHEHSHCGHDHGDCTHEHHESSPVPSVSFGSGNDHDADALYLPTGTPSAGSSDRGNAGSFKSRVTKAWLAAFVILNCSVADLGQVNFRRHPPETRAPNCALYLVQRTLRI